MEPCCTVELCDRCVADSVAQLRGTAECRGHYWAAELEQRRDLRDLPWPTGSDKLRAIALVKVADLTRDLRVREVLAGALELAAERRWSRRAI